MLIIAFGHKKFSGKDTAAKFLCSDLIIKYPNKLIVKRGFADKIKDIAHSLYSWAGVKPKEYYDIYPEEKETFLSTINKTTREIWIDIGMKIREIYPDTWIDYLLKGVKADILLISDLRFPNEFQKIKQLNGYCIRIDRDDITKQNTIRSQLQVNDVADCALQTTNMKDLNISWDFTVDNNGTLKEFYQDLMYKLYPVLKNIEK